MAQRQPRLAAIFGRRYMQEAKPTETGLDGNADQP
jgi:hypothetical protein